MNVKKIDDIIKKNRKEKIKLIQWLLFLLAFLRRVVKVTAVIYIWQSYP